MRQLQWHKARVVERGGYACGVVSARLQRVESVRVEKKIDKADIGNAAIVVCPGLERIVCYHDLLEGITGMPKREGLLFALFGGGEGIRRLDVDLPGTSIDDEVYLILSRLMDAVLAVIENHHADVHRISTPDEFAVDDIFHQMGRFCLPEVDPGISETGVGRVVLDRIIEIVSSFDIVSRGFKNQECVLEAVEVFDYGGARRLSSFIFMDYAKKMKPNVVCHNHWADAIAQFQFHEKIQKNESGRRVRRVAAPNAICKEAA